MDTLHKFEQLYNEAVSTYQNQLPLCAAENVVSPFSKIMLTSSLQEKYLLGASSKYQENNFLGSDKLFEFNILLNQLCLRLYGAKYADARTLSGINAVTSLLMSLFEVGDIVFISNDEYGGHTSIKKICKRLGIKTRYIPYDYDNLDIDYKQLNEELMKENVKGVLVCLSDILFQPSLEKIELPEDCILLYDATQTLGLIAGKENKNPFDYFESSDDNFIMFGAAHKTLPGVTCGLILTNNPILLQKYESINPDYLRNTHFHHILSLITTLIEFEKFGKEYSKNIRQMVESLSVRLLSGGFTLISGERCSETHQIWLSFPNQLELNIFYEACCRYGISVTKREKKVYNDFGIRIGLQEIARYKWDNNIIDTIAIILTLIKKNMPSEEITKHVDIFVKSNRTINYTFSEVETDKFKQNLHDS
ncbi:aminotransferase class I/II-fold pyridoxal phosphate-dependent enzyme [Lactococcus lactis]|uniref:aminotransferase class I/II-fold pyridoxal phosphate-dependent enzyme n=1 Tax=Lactococcus lactis TaxID=1358 RepID=UPI0022E3528D|nr:aminotransferase class I/II-fold pyridoxal phosphate-dependent enzyme [Lactococcus lactis]